MGGGTGADGLRDPFLMNDPLQVFENHAADRAKAGTEPAGPLTAALPPVLQLGWKMHSGRGALLL